MRLPISAFLFTLLFALPALAQEGPVFTDGPGGAAIHAASGYICPAKIGSFERDAVGLNDPETGAVYCTYSALSGVYGTVIVMPLPAVFDPKAVLAGQFRIQESTGGRVLSEEVQAIGQGDGALPVYRRTYETARLESLYYRTLLASAAVGAWTVQTIVEYSATRDPGSKDGAVVSEFLNEVYGAALRDLAAPLATPPSK